VRRCPLRRRMGIRRSKRAECQKNPAAAGGTGSTGQYAGICDSLRAVRARKPHGEALTCWNARQIRHTRATAVPHRGHAVLRSRGLARTGRARAAQSAPRRIPLEQGMVSQYQGGETRHVCRRRRGAVRGRVTTARNRRHDRHSGRANQRWGSSRALGHEARREWHGHHLVLSDGPATSLAIITLQRLQGDQGERTPYSWLITRMWVKLTWPPSRPEFEFHFSSAHHNARFRQHS